MELGVQVTGPYSHVSQVVALCERAGIAAVALADHYLYGSSDAEFTAPAYDSLVQAAALARDTSNVEIVMLVSPITFRHPAVYAKTLTTIDEISDGRFVFGLGTGWHDGEHDVFGFEYPSLSERFEWLEDALGYIRSYVDDPSAGYEGSVWSRRAIDLHPHTRRNLRIMVGGGGPKKTPTLVGRFANEYNLYHHTAKGIDERLDTMRRAAEAAGRDPDAIFITTCYPMVGGSDAHETEEFLAEMGSSRGLNAGEMRLRLGDRIPIMTWDAHAERLGEFETLGFERVYLQTVAQVAGAVESALAVLA